MSSGAPPAAIALVRVSGPAAFAAGQALAGALPPPRNARLRRLHDPAGAPLDDALVLTFPGPTSATGEDLLELHLHGGRAIVRAVLATLAARPGLRAAEPGEFTRRALGNGRIDLAEAEGLADLLAAESETARRAALSAAEGGVSRVAREWCARLLSLSARVEAQIDFSDEDDVPAEAAELAAIRDAAAVVADDLADALARPAIERLRDGFRIVLAGPPNSGKSSLINEMAEREVAIAAPVPGTTRDRIEAPVLRDGIAYILTDTAGLREDSSDPVETIGITRAKEAVASADMVIWLGDDQPPDPAMLAIHARSDLPGRSRSNGRLAVSATTGAGVNILWQAISARCDALLPRDDTVMFNSRQRDCVAGALAALRVEHADDPLLLAESLRQARAAIDGIYGAAALDAMLDELFGRFCIGK